MDIPAEHAFSACRKAIRFVALCNFLMFVLFVVPATNRWIERGFVAVRPIGLEALVGRSLQVWLAGSTLLITALLGCLFWQKHKATAAQLGSESVRIEGIFVAIWWLIVLGACAYGFALGMGS